MCLEQLFLMQLNEIFLIVILTMNHKFYYRSPVKVLDRRDHDKNFDGILSFQSPFRHEPCRVEKIKKMY